MENPSSPLETLRQLKEMLDSGALTPTEFEALKQRLVFAPAPAAPSVTPPPSATPPTTPVLQPPAAVEPDVPTAASSPAWLTQPLPAVVPATPETATAAHAAEVLTEPAGLEEATLLSLKGTAGLPPVAAAPEYGAVPDADYRPAPQPAYAWPTELATPVPSATPDFAAEEEIPAPVPERSSPLGLILAIGAVLVFLAVVGYLGFNRPVSEHLSSTSQTAADSVAATIETGPQVAPLAPPAAEPETVRIAPAHPAPALPSRATMNERAATVRDSAGAGAQPAADSAGPR